jgi:hypothetical protein
VASGRCDLGRAWSQKGVAPGDGGVATAGVAMTKGLRGQPLSPVDVVVERVVAPESDEGPQAQPVGEEDLGSCIQPHL